jgi:uncharacterized protein (TIGR03435 family)
MIASGQVQIGVTVDAKAVRINNFSLYNMIHFAFQVKSHEMWFPGRTIAGRYDVQAEVPDGGTRGQVPAMLRTLFRERFHMVTHKESGARLRSGSSQERTQAQTVRRRTARKLRRWTRVAAAQV